MRTGRRGRRGTQGNIGCPLSPIDVSDTLAALGDGPQIAAAEIAEINVSLQGLGPHQPADRGEAIAAADNLKLIRTLNAKKHASPLFSFISSDRLNREIALFCQP